MKEEMTLLAMETSAGPVSCALLQCKGTSLDNITVLSEASATAALPHSRTLMPMMQAVLQNAGVTAEKIDMLAVALGPGSFTGVRIGLSSVKGIAFTNDLPCVGVSTLEAMAYLWQGTGMQGLIVPAMDARCGQIYTAMFESDGRQVRRLTPDEAITQQEMCARLQGQERPVFLLGDGARMCYDAWKASCPTLRLAPAPMRYQQAVGVGLAALAHREQACSAALLQPIYLRLPQAERELKARRAAQG